MEKLQNVELINDNSKQEVNSELIAQRFSIWAEKINAREREMEKGNLNSLYPDHKKKIDSFLKSRKRKNTKDHVLKIIRYLMINKNRNKGWIRSIDLLNHFYLHDPNTGALKFLSIPASTFFKIMRDLEQDDIVERKIGHKTDMPGRGTKPVCYRLRPGYRDIDLMTHDELLLEIHRLKGEIKKCAIKHQLFFEEIKKFCDKLNQDFSVKDKEIGEKALDIWNKGSRDTFGEWK